MARALARLLVPLLAFAVFALAASNSTAGIPQGKIADTFASYNQVEEINRALNPLLHDILHNTDFFGYYRLNLYEAQCPVSWNDAYPMCGNRACAVDTLLEEQIPEIWRASVLGQVSGPIAPHPSYDSIPSDPESTPLGGALGSNTAEQCIFERNDYDSDRDYCIPEDESSSSGGVYVSLVNNPERFTGYAGDHAHAIWREIYRENCFEMQDGTSYASKSQSEWARSDLEAVMLGKGKVRGGGVTGITGELDREEYELQLENTCLEKRVFWRLISGMHTSISTHLCWEYLNQTSGEWGPNVDCFKSRVWNHPQWIENLYFNYVVVLRALTKLSTYLDSYTYCSGDSHLSLLTQQKVHSLISTAQLASPPSFDESRMFDPHDPTISGLKAEFRQRFRNVSQIMDCVGCDKCRLWGKLQTSGYGTALKVLFEFDPEDVEGKNEDFHLRRTEVVSLIVTLQRLSHSIWAVGQFKEMISGGSMLSCPLAPSLPTHENHPVFSLSQKLVQYWESVKFVSLGQAFEEEVGEISKALQFVLKSYVFLPVNLWRTGIVFMANVWDKYVVGRTVIGKSALNL